MTHHSTPTAPGWPQGGVSRQLGGRLPLLALMTLLASCGGGSDGGGGESGIAAGAEHACALRNGAVSCWGSNWAGNLGDGTTTERGSAVRVRDVSGAITIAVGRSHSCAVVSDGVRCWGANGNKQLGNSALVEDRSTVPVRVDTLSAGVQSVALGMDHSCALVSGAVKCWGSNASKQLGAASGTESTTPLQVPELGSGVEAISAGDLFTCAMVNGGVKCWGDGIGGKLGDGNVAAHTRATPYATIPEASGVTAIASGNGTTCALLADEVKCWGYNGFGMTGSGCAGEYCTSPTVVLAAPEGTTSLQVADSNLYLLVNGGVKALGADELGELGNGEPRTSSTSLVDVSGLSSGVSQVSAWMSSTCALLENGGVRCWGLNHAHQLGDETTTNRSAPVAVQGL